jgi:hypothetical protein
MQFKPQLSLEGRERLRQQSALLLKLYQTELAKDPASFATAASRSNLLALHHTIAQMYGDG